MMINKQLQINMAKISSPSAFPRKRECVFLHTDMVGGWSKENKENKFPNSSCFYSAMKLALNSTEIWRILLRCNQKS